ncbi:Oidioi.mRNA.OKI2018_I69.chr1.g2605.t1.cds [Oikopleura dioica]|uniref:Oidioi.mRNA.OKI2018_I69.chr1.g2605.t1.cds n=1 Tax=Oikopleura dioica TaxID=34765 RepID=A0ABN7SXZ7_OIKDI|nr:Oidioi.mRNA.OKI2018_I69.chr1.g2605.t1.cds [Oikopleura dioica]
MDTFQGIRSELIVNYGNMRCCNLCGWGVVKIYGLPCQWQICAKCQDFDEEFVLMFGSLNDAVFRCPASMAGKGCGANDLCFRDLILGTCCARAMRTHYDIGGCDIFLFTQQYLKRAKTREAHARLAFVNGKEWLANALKNLREAKDDISKWRESAKEIVEQAIKEFAATMGTGQPPSFLNDLRRREAILFKTRTDQIREEVEESKELISQALRAGYREVELKYEVARKESEMVTLRYLHLWHRFVESVEKIEEKIGNDKKKDQE